MGVEAGACSEIQRLFESDRLKGAARALRASARSGAAVWEVYLWLGRLQAKAGLLGAAVDSLRMALRISPAGWGGRADTCMTMGRLLEQVGRPEDAWRAYRSAMRVEPTNVSLRLEIARICMRQGLHSRACNHLRRALVLSGRSTEACLAMADFQRGRANFREAERWLCAAGKESKNPEVDFKFGWLYGQQRDFERMRRSFRRYVSKAGPTGDSLTRFFALMGLDDFQGAFEAAESFLDHPRQAELDRFLRLWPENWLRQHDKSFYRSKRDALNAWQQEHPASPWPGFIKGATCWRMYHLDEALLELRDLERLPEPRYGWMRYLPGLIKIMMRRHAEARADFEAAVRCADGFWQAHCRLAESLLCLGEDRAAWGQFARAEMQESQSEVWGWRGEALLWNGDYAAALQWLNRAVGAGSWLAVCWRAGAQMLLGNHEAALRDLNRAIVSGSMDAEAYTWRGELHRRMGNLTSARLDLQRADALSEGEWIFANLGLLCLAEGDVAGMRRQFGRIDAEVVRHIEGEMGLRQECEHSEAEIQGILETGLTLARGVRRHEPYLRDVWMIRDQRRIAPNLDATPKSNAE